MRGAEIRFVGPPGWRRLPPVTRITLVLAAAGYLAVLIWPVFLNVVAVAPGAVLQLQLWRLLTYPLGIVGIFNVLFDLLLLWQFGSELESGWGSRRFALFLLACTLVAAVIGVAASFALRGGSPWPLGFWGMSGVITAMIVAWTLRGPDLPANLFGLLPLTRKGFAVLALVLVVFGELEQSRSLPRLFYLLGGLPVAWWFTRGGTRGGMAMRPPRFFRRSRLRVVRGDEDYRIH